MVPEGEVWRVLQQRPKLALFVLAHERDAAEYVAVIEDIAEKPALRTTTLDEALAATDRLVWFAPPVDEAAAAVQTLEARRDSLLDRAEPLLLAVHRDGPGMVALADAPGLVSWLAANTVDEGSDRGSALAPGEVDGSWEIADARERFEEAHGATPEEWLARWRRGEIEDRGEATWTYHHALGLERGAGS